MGSFNVPATTVEVDGTIDNDIAICGFSLKFPQDATSAESFWRMMMDRHCASTDFPPDRINANGFYRSENTSNTLPLRSGHFIKEDLSVFDADFFGISPTEATAMDPMQRWLLETTYHALENAGITMQSISNSRTGVYTGSFGLDYMLQLARDPENTPTYTALGFGLSMLANRISWYFNLRGPSIGLDSACSSTAMAIDIACQSLKSGSCEMALVAGCNLATAPEAYMWMSNINFLSPDGRSHSFDHRANGYARGEGIAVVVLKRLPDAIRDGNTIRAVIRSTGANEDGKTPGITQPSSVAQRRLIEETYRKASLSMKHTRFFEAHGTGTPIGDPREARAIGSAFQAYRDDNDPLYIGAVKSNIGHLEGASGLAGLIKTVLSLEKGIIPPNTNFEKLNPKIDSKHLRIRFPEKSYPWPEGELRRASVNSFGYGGANAHIVIDDAYNYLRLRSLSAKHCTAPTPTPMLCTSTNHTNGIHEVGENGIYTRTTRLLVWSTADKKGCERTIQAYKDWLGGADSLPRLRTDEFLLADLAYTLDTHRTHLPWRFFAIIDSPQELEDLASRMSSPIRGISPDTPRLGFIFTGQGAQWAKMGIGLLSYHSFAVELEEATEFLRSFGCSWAVIDELLKDDTTTKINRAEYSQTLCTILQVALVNLFKTFGVRPASVVGHSSGEIAAAYAAGHLTRESAWKLAYFRGLCSAELAETHTDFQKGSMMSVGLPEEDLRDMVNEINEKATNYGLSIACINSPSNVTVSGEESLIDQLRTKLDAEDVFCRKLRVPLAYHSKQMEAISEKYANLVGQLYAPEEAKTPIIPMLSSVTGTLVKSKELTDPSYWVRNMVSPVLFSHSVQKMCEQSRANLAKKIDRSHVFASVVEYLVEIGPSNALQSPIRDILLACPRGKAIGYSSVLKRGQSAIATMLQTIGELHCKGVDVNLRLVNEPTRFSKARSILTSVPGYAFDRSQKYWHESRLSKAYRFRHDPPSEFLGVRSNDWNKSNARWRHLIKVSEMPWIEHHVVNGRILYPGSGMLVMAIEAAKQLIQGAHTIDGYMLYDVSIENPIDLTANKGNVEVQTSLYRRSPESAGNSAFEFTVSTYTEESWSLNCRGIISVSVSDGLSQWDQKKVKSKQREAAIRYSELVSACTNPVKYRDMYAYLRQTGYEYGPLFQVALDQRCNQRKQAAAEISLFESQSSHVIHPISLDALLHLSLTAFSVGGESSMAVSVPSAIKRLWISNHGLNQAQSKSITALTTVVNCTRRGFTCTGAAMNSDNPEDLRVWFEGLELTFITKHQVSEAIPNPKQFCMRVSSKVALNKLNTADIYAYLNELHPPQHNLSNIYGDIEILIEKTLEKVFQNVNPDELMDEGQWQKHYWNWSIHHMQSRHQIKSSPTPPTLSKEVTPEELLAISEELRKTGPIGYIYVMVVENLQGLLEGKVNALDLLIQSGAAKEYYRELGLYRGALQAASYVELLAHQTPGLRFLEVGGGTAATTRRLIHKLSSKAEDEQILSSSLNCKSYDFTDVGSSFVDRAHQEFVDFEPQMTFRVLDVERDIAEQGFNEQYDVVIADAVLHVTSNLGYTIRNIRKTLKTGGKIIMHEPIRSSGWTTGFVFGVFPGWWMGVNDNRPLSPCVDINTWDLVLKQNGFNGVELFFRDFEDEPSHHFGWLVSTAIEETPNPSRNLQQPQVFQRATIILDRSNIGQEAFALDIQKCLLTALGLPVYAIDIEEALLWEEHCLRSSSNLLILLIDYGSPYISTINETRWTYLQSLIPNAHHMLWVTSGGGCDGDPTYAMVDGFARTLRSEFYQLHLVTLALEGTDSKGQRISHITEVVREMKSHQLYQSYEEEYIEMSGRLCTRRLVESKYDKAQMDAILLPYETVTVSANEHSRFMMTRLPLDTGDQSTCYTELPLAPSSEENYVDILVRAASVYPNNLAGTTTHQNIDLESGVYFCSGIVLGVSDVDSQKSSLHLHDRIFTIFTGPIRSHIRVPWNTVVRIPEHMPHAEACVSIPPMLVAYQILVDINPTASIMVENGRSPIGQSMINILSNQNALNIWTTALNQDDASWIEEKLQVQEERILPSNWADNQLMSINGQKFDVVISFDTMPDLISPTISSIESGGQLISVRTESLVDTAAKLVHSAPSSVLLRILHLDTDFMSSKLGTQTALNHAVLMATRSTTGNTKQAYKEIPGTDLNAVFDSMKQSSSFNPIILTFNDSDLVAIRRKTLARYSLSANATYVIAGGLGGLGRAFAERLIERGARYLILLSRSGPKTPEQRRWLTELTDKNIHVETPCCDITDREALRTVLNGCLNRMPPIEGCIQSSMVMKESIFQRLTHEDWEAATKSKVQGSWNLHTELPSGLKFFVLISSVMGILGTASLSAYNAGNTYCDALARYRISQGQPAVSLDLGAVPDGGYLVESNANQLQDLNSKQRYAPVPIKELLALLDVYCDPKNGNSYDTFNCQRIIGIRPPAHWKHLEEVPTTLAQPFWGHMHYIPALTMKSEAKDVETADKRRCVLDTVARLKATGLLSEAIENVCEALTHKASLLLGTPEDRIDIHKPMHSYGLDSLSAIDIRNWVALTFKVSVNTSDLLGGATFADVGERIMRGVQHETSQK